MHGQHMIKMLSAMQKVIALASAELEYYSMVRGAAAGRGFVFATGRAKNALDIATG